MASRTKAGADAKIALPPKDGATTLEELVEEPAVVDPFVIGPASAPMTPGWLMGIGSRPETAEEHAARLGASAGTFADAGFLLGSLEARSEWPAPPPEVIPVLETKD